jgi:hypothetical protein
MGVVEQLVEVAAVEAVERIAVVEVGTAVEDMVVAKK